MLKTIEIDLTYQPFLEGPPEKPQELLSKASASDDVTIKFWRDIWVNQTKQTKERFGSFADRSIGKLYGINRMKPAIICGSGPSLKDSIDALRENALSDHPVLNISCLHNFGFFEDEGFHADYYLSLDSGEIVVNDVFEGRKEPPEFYWEKTKGKTLLCNVQTSPKLFDLWQGEVVLFNSLIPEIETHNEIQAVERFTHFVGAGGNALGGCLYVAHQVFASHGIHFVGADFCFDYNNQFHSYKTHYDTVGGYVQWPDCFGVIRKTWQSYLNFKYYFDYIACTIPNRFINCSGGILGAYRDGNIRQFQYMSLKDALLPYRAASQVYLQKMATGGASVLESTPLKLKDLWGNPEYPLDMTLF